MNFAPYLVAIGRRYRLSFVTERDGLRLWQARARRLFAEPFYLACTQLFYLPENEHRIRETIGAIGLNMPRPYQTPKVLVLCSYNGMVDLSGDDLRSFTKHALINYLLLERQEKRWICADRFFEEGSDEPRRVRELLSAVDRERAGAE